MLDFRSTFTQELPGDTSQAQGTREVLGACYSLVSPTPVSNPTLAVHAREVAELVGLPGDGNWGDFVQVLGGNVVTPGMKPYAACYGGHQFGNWAGQLGDGRAITLGEAGADGQSWELQLKGAGPTPYSRMGDGRAVMRSSVREFLCSEAMHHLGVPTTRALSLVRTGDSVVRDMFYDGNRAAEPGAIVCRVAPSFLRFGNFEILTWRRDNENLAKLADYAIDKHFPGVASQGLEGPERYVAWLEEVARRTAVMMVHWMRVGFVHGVMNTDNMSILGLTIDYGPYGWLEGYDPRWTPNTTDSQNRRYRFGSQPQVALWNLARFAESLHPLVGDVAPLEGALAVYQDTYAEVYRSTMAKKLGLMSFRVEGDTELVEELWRILALTETDMTIFFRQLAQVEVSQCEADGQQLLGSLVPAYYNPKALVGKTSEAVVAWVRRYLERVSQDDQSDAERAAVMNSVNPKYVMRNYLAQEVIDAAERGDDAPLAELLEVMRRPYDEQPDAERFAQRRPEWARHKPGCSMLSCSS